MDKYKGWMCDLMEHSTQSVLSTVKKVLKDSDDEMSYDDLEKLEKCWDIIKDMHKIKHIQKEMEPTPNGHPVTPAKA